MKKPLIKTLVVSMFLSLAILPSFAGMLPLAPVRQVKFDSQKLGNITQGGYLFEIYGDINTGEITQVIARDNATGLDAAVWGWEGSVSGQPGAISVGAKIYLQQGSKIIRLNGVLS